MCLKNQNIYIFCYRFHSFDKLFLLLSVIHENKDCMNDQAARICLFTYLVLFSHHLVRGDHAFCVLSVHRKEIKDTDRDLMAKFSFLDDIAQTTF